MVAISDRLTGLAKHEQLQLALLAILIGAAASVGGILFRDAVAEIQFATFGAATERLASRVANLPWWLILIVPTLGGLVVGLLRRYVARDQRFHGVADVMEASALRGGRITLRDGLVAATGSALSLGVGGSAGREGPVVHLGAMLASLAARNLGLRRSAVMTLLGCGVASAVSSSFNAPIAGVFFALEVVVGHYGLSAFAPVVLASIIGTIITRIHYGDFPAFIIESHAIVSFWEMPAFAILGLLSAAVALVFMRSIFAVQDIVTHLRIPVALAPMGGGLLVGIIALFLPEILGVGYEATDLALHNAMALHLLIALAFAKTMATAITIGSGFGGGVFSPSLFVGAMVGGAYGIIATSMGPEISSHDSVYAIVGMAAVAGAVLGAPISTILIVFELTANFGLTIAVMIGATAASLVTNHVFGRSFFRRSLERRGIDISGSRSMQLLQTRTVDSIMSHAFESLRANDPLATVRHSVRTNPMGDFVVVDETGCLSGIITIEDLHPWLLGDRKMHDDAARALARTAARTLYPSDSLRKALDVMASTDDGFVPVVRGENDRMVVGVLRRHTLILAHNRALAEAARERT
ncbi:MAG: chloride channel protein [Rhodospirillales bacterium]|nr:chloride channel protein [Rhodospirillales bacterium]